MIDKPSERHLPTPREAISILLITFLGVIVYNLLASGVNAKLFLIGSRLVFVVPMLLFLTNRHFSLRTTLRLRPVSFRVAVLCLLIGIALSIIGEELDRLMQLLIQLPEQGQQILQEEFGVQSLFDWLVMVLGVVALTGFFEELLFRGFVQNVLEGQMDTTRAVLVTSFLFSLFYANPVSMAQILIIGVILGVLAWKSNSILPSTIAHIGINAAGIYLLLGSFENSALFNWQGHVNPLLLLIAAGVLYISVLLFYKFTEEDAEISTFLNEPL